MGTRLQTWWYGLNQSFWFLPAVLTLSCLLLALLTVRLDHALLLDRQTEMPWLFGGGAEGARGVLQAIAGTMITVTALVFSITVVALQLAASQLSPRVLPTFLTDRGNQAVLGFFIGTFTYALLVLRAVRSPLEGSQAFVPALSVTAAIVLALLSVALLIYFVHHATNAMRASVVIDRAATATRGLIADLFPDDVGETARSEPPAWLAAVPAWIVNAKRGGYVQSINAEALFALAEHQALTLRLEPMIGDFVLPGEPLVSCWPTPANETEVGRAVHAALSLGSERTLQSDIAFGFQQLSDIAVKALSPGINDPTTAMICIDRLGEALVTLACRGKPDEVRRSDDGSVRVVMQGPPFSRLVGVAFDQIRHFGAGNPEVAAHLLSSLARCAKLVPSPHRDPLVRQARLVLAATQARTTIKEDLQRIDEAGAWLSNHQ